LLPPPSEPWSPPATAIAPTAEVIPVPQNSAGENVGNETNTVAPPDLIVEEEESYWYQPRYWIDPLPWDTSLELGINGSSGTSESFSIRAGGSIKRESRFSKLDLSTYHNRTTTSGESTQNNAQLDVRNDWLLDECSPWTLFGSGNVFYDEFQAFDLQTNANTGVGYRFVHDPDLGMIGRVGGGTSREFGGPDDRWVPESLFGFEYNQQLSQTQKFYTKLDYFPEWEEFGEFRLVADAGWEIELAQPSNLSLKISANDRYDSTPNGAEPHLVNYSVLLLLKL
jgi:putative salt-induced outer membrane protein YdiY